MAQCAWSVMFYSVINPKYEIRGKRQSTCFNAASVQYPPIKIFGVKINDWGALGCIFYPLFIIYTVLLALIKSHTAVH